MFNALSIPFGCVMLYNVVKLKEGVTEEDVELVLGDMCNVVKTPMGMMRVGLSAGRYINFPVLSQMKDRLHRKNRLKITSLS